MTADTMHFAAEAVERLTPLHRHERAGIILTGEVGPLYTCPLSPTRAIAAYVVYLAWIRARVPGHMLSGRPGFEAWETMTGRVRTAIRRSATGREWGVDLFERLNLRITGLQARDALWWVQVRDTLRWHELADDTAEATTDIVQGAKLLDELLRELPETPNTTT